VGSKLKVIEHTAILILALCLVPAGALAQGPAGIAHLTALQPTQPPKGFAGICNRYSWACSGKASATVLDGAAILNLAATINSQVNRSIKAVDDAKNFGVAEHWSLPVGNKGDCEDYALLKKLRLIKAGVAPNRLLLAQVFTRTLQPHVVLVLRTGDGDYLLDNLTARMMFWHKTGYTIVKMQNPKHPSAWDAILLGPHARRNAHIASKPEQQ
jgi:predicted transglutaminase-like cysteine proteinase